MMMQVIIILTFVCNILVWHLWKLLCIATQKQITLSSSLLPSVRAIEQCMPKSQVFSPIIVPTIKIVTSSVMKYLCWSSTQTSTHVCVLWTMCYCACSQVGGWNVRTFQELYLIISSHASGDKRQVQSIFYFWGKLKALASKIVHMLMQAQC